MFKIAKWYNNYQAPSVLMIDDLSDAYIGVYDESYKNDWGYLCDKEGSSYDYLSKELLNKYPDIKITFFTPYLRHNVINENTKYNYKKYSVGERKEFSAFLVSLVAQGHEIAHHGSNHGKYIDIQKVTTVNNWIHEWALFNEVKSGVDITLAGVDIFKKYCNINVVGGKYCGYIFNDISQEIIDYCNFSYWCDKPSYNSGTLDEDFFGKNKIISFPTNFPGNAFVRLSYKTGNHKKDRKKKILKLFQPLYNIYSYIYLYRLYKKRRIISIQEHNSPSTSAGTVQSANIITDIKSLNKIFNFLGKLNIWYATCEEIAKYIYIRENSKLTFDKKKKILEINFDNYKNTKDNYISIVHDFAFTLIDPAGKEITSKINNNLHTVTLNISSGSDLFKIIS